MSESKLRVEGVDLGQVVQLAKGFADQSVVREAGRARWEGFRLGATLALGFAVAAVGLAFAVGAVRFVPPERPETGPVGVPAGGTPAPLPPIPGLPPSDRK